VIKRELFFIFLGIILLGFNFVSAVGFSSDTNNTNEWWMLGKYLNHTNWDGVSYSTISGLNSANFTTGNIILSSPAVANGYVYIGSSDTRIYQLDASNISQQIANFTTGYDISYSSPAVANGYVYIGSLDNNVYQLNASNVSQQIANFTTGNDVSSSPAVANGYVYIGSLDNNVYQLNASNVSQQIANFTTGNIILSSPAVANGYVYIGSLDNNVYQLNASNVGLTNDYASPVITLISPVESTSSTTSNYNFTFNVTDSSTVSNCSLIFDGSVINLITSVNNTGGTNGMYSSSLSVATHTWGVNCTDIFGNIGNSSTRSLIVSSETSVISSSRSGGYAPQTYYTDEKLSTNGNNFTLRYNDKIKFIANLANHTLTLNNFNSTSARVLIQSDSITAYLEKGELYLFDLNNDSVNDVKIRYAGMNNSKAIIFIQEIELAINTNGSKNIQAESNKETFKYNNLIFILGLMVFIGVVILASVLLKRPKKRGK